MASTFAEAIAKIDGPEFDARVGYSVSRPEPSPVDGEISAAFADFDHKTLRRVALRIARQQRCDLADAEDAIQDTLVSFLTKRPRLLKEKPGSWMGLFIATARYGVNDVRATRGRTASLEALAERAGDVPFEGARPCVSPSHDGEPDAKFLWPPRIGEQWNRTQIIGAIQRFRDDFGRPPKSDECRALNRLPSISTVYRYFDRFADAILAAGMVSETSTGQRRSWSPLEAAKACRAFRERNGFWPSWADVKRRPGALPSTSVMIRCFGGTRSIDVQLGTDAILFDAGA
ncbi:MAG: hypothetical protein JJE13_09440 [Thermoleophilia bacterium]|nr:hypothetical protein [Thermoleophilia bacterium]